MLLELGWIYRMLMAGQWLISRNNKPSQTFYAKLLKVTLLNAKESHPLHVANPTSRNDFESGPVTNCSAARAFLSFFSAPFVQLVDGLNPGPKLGTEVFHLVALSPAAEMIGDWLRYAAEKGTAGRGTAGPFSVFTQCFFKTSR